MSNNKGDKINMVPFSNNPIPHSKQDFVSTIAHIIYILNYHLAIYCYVPTVASLFYGTKEVQYACTARWFSPINHRRGSFCGVKRYTIINIIPVRGKGRRHASWPGTWGAHNLNNERILNVCICYGKLNYIENVTAFIKNKDYISFLSSLHADTLKILLILYKYFGTEWRCQHV